MVIVQNYQLTNKENEYLTIIYEFLENGLNRVKISELASKTLVTQSAVSSIIKRLDTKIFQSGKLIYYAKGHGVALTEEGQKLAGKIIRRRRISEIFLKELEFDFFSIQKQIKLISITDELSDKLVEKYFKNDTENRCSHGYLIPNRNGIYQFEKLKSINQFNTNSEVEIIKIPESPFFYLSQFSPSETDFFLKIYNYNLIPKKIVKIITKENNFMIIETESGNVKISNGGIADHIYVKIID